MNFTAILWGLALCVTSLAVVIEVDNTNGHDTPSCCSENAAPCKTLDYALNNGLTSSTTVMIYKGLYNIHLLNLSFFDLESVAIYGAGSNLTTIQCSFGTGLAFFNVRQLVLANFTLLGGGRIMNSTSINTTTNDVAVFRVALYLLDCSNVTIEGLIVTNSTGTGLVMYDVTGNVDIINSVFQFNMPLENEELPSDGGFSVMFTYCKPGKTSCDETKVNDTFYRIQNCTFLSNIATSSNHTKLLQPSLYASVHQQFGCGGGLKVLMRGVAQNNTIVMKDSKFLHNQAVWGGGLCIELLDHSKGNYFVLEDLVFDRNYLSLHNFLKITGNGGGAVRIAVIPIFFLDYNTTFNFINCSFLKNSADHGGGISLELIRTPGNSTYFYYTNCTWYHNIGRIGSAIDAYVYKYPFGKVATFVFDTCNFTENSNDYSQFPVKPLGLGAMYLWSVPVKFTNRNVFIGNNGSALVGISTWCIFNNGAVVVFEKNTAKNGGAITLLDNSYLILFENTTLNFTQNSADNKGGALYVDKDDQRSFTSNRFCFIFYYNITLSPYEWKEKNITIYFSNNSAKSGNSIFTTTLLSCVWKGLTHIGLTEVKQVYFWNGTFTYEGVANISDLDQEISSEVTHIGNLTNTSYTFPPGKLFYFDLVTDNERNEAVDTVYFVTTNDSSVAVVEKTLSYTSESKTMLYGAPGSEIDLKMVTVNSFPLSLSINIKLGDCPPGFCSSIEAGSNKTICKCSVNIQHQAYLGIVECDSVNMVAYLRPAYYAGYVTKVHKDGKHENILVTANCPEGYCYYNENNSNVELPPNSSTEALDDLICKPNNRKGHLCGKCSKRKYIYVNPYKYECGECPNSWVKGVFILIGLKYIPLTIFLYIIGLFGISLVNGPLNTVVLFSQLLPYMKIYDADGKHTKIIQCLYGMWNLNFFELVYSKFCVLPIQSALAMLIFNNLTPVVFGLVLSSIYIFIAESESCREYCSRLSRCVQKYRNMIKWLNKKICGHEEDETSTCFRSQGLITCVVLCYAKLTALAFGLLSSTTLYGLCKDASKEHLQVFRLDGTKTYMSDALWAVAIATICICFILIIPLIIIFYPCCCKRKCPLHTYYSQFYVSLRLCYKDNLIACGFTGIYLFYRIGALIIYAFTSRVDLQYLWQCGFFLVTMLIHCMVQPYRKRIYNIIDGIIFFNMSIISLLSLYRLYAVDVGLSGTDKAFTFQLILIYLPFAYILLLWPCIRLYKIIKKKYKNVDGYTRKLIMKFDYVMLTDYEVPVQRNQIEIDGCRDAVSSFISNEAVNHSHYKENTPLLRSSDL